MIDYMYIYGYAVCTFNKFIITSDRYLQQVPDTVSG